MTQPLMFIDLSVKEHGLLARKTFTLIRDLASLPEPPIALVWKLADALHNFPVDLDNLFLIRLTRSKLSDVIRQHPDLRIYYSEFLITP